MSKKTVKNERHPIAKVDGRTQGSPPQVPCSTTTTSGMNGFNQCGLIWVKFPVEYRGNSWKVWGLKFVGIKTEVVLRPESVSTCVLLVVHKTDKPDSEIIFKKRLTSQNTVLFRSKSRTQEHAFTIFVDEDPLIHLSCWTETETQAWLSSIRNTLWPPTPDASLETTLGSYFHVSIIDNEFSFKAGLIGMYGNLQITSSKAVLTHPQKNQIIKEWLLSTVGFKILPQSHPEDTNKVVTMITDATSTTGYGTIIMYCPEAEELIQRVHTVRRMFVTKSYGEQMKEDLEKERIESPTSSGDEGSRCRSLADSYTHYMSPKMPPVRVLSCPDEPPKFEFKKTLNDPWLDNIVRKTLGDDETGKNSNEYRKFFPSNWNKFGNISEVVLDSSINFRSAYKTISEDSPLVTSDPASDSKASLRRSSSDAGTKQ